jgi:hypothetical protein
MDMEDDVPGAGIDPRGVHAGAARDTPHFQAASANIRHGFKMPVHKPYLGTGRRRGAPRRDPFVSWRGNNPGTKPAGWTKFAVPLNRASLMSSHSWTVLLRQKGLPVTGVTKAGMSLLAGWEDEGIELALEKAVACYNAGKRSNKFGHSTHIHAAANNAQTNQSMGLGMAPDTREFLQHRSETGRQRYAELAGKATFTEPRDAYAMTFPVYKKLWKVMKQAAKASGLGGMMQMSTPMQQLYNNQVLSSALRAAFNLSQESVNELAQDRGAIGLVHYNNGQPSLPDGIRIPPPAIYYLLGQHISATEAGVLAKFHMRREGNVQTAANTIRAAATQTGNLVGIRRQCKKFYNLYKRAIDDQEPMQQETRKKAYQDFANASMYGTLLANQYQNVTQLQGGKTGIISLDSLRRFRQPYKRPNQLQADTADLARICSIVSA